MKAYFASLSDYNGGILHGAWIDLENKTEEDIQDEINAMLAESPYAKQYGEKAEEYAIHDYEDMPRAFGEYASLSDLMEYVELASDKYEGETFQAAFDYYGNIKDAQGATADCVAVCDSFRDYADNLADELLHDAPESLKRYFDYEAFARDLEHDYTVVEFNDKTFIFNY